MRVQGFGWWSLRKVGVVQFFPFLRFDLQGIVKYASCRLQSTEAKQGKAYPAVVGVTDSAGGFNRHPLILNQLSNLDVRRCSE